MPSANLLSQLRAIVGEAHLHVAAEDLAPYLEETRRLAKGTAIAAVAPANTEQVSAIVTACQQAGVNFVAQGGNTGLVGGGVPHGGVVISLRRMKAIEPVDAVNAAITVEAGVVLAQVQAAAREAGFLYPLSLASEGSCTIGGNIAANAGGTAVLRYGNTRDLVLGLEVVLPDGAIWNGLSALRKDNAGYDLKHLFIGSEGTLGIVTKAVLKLFPLPKARATAFVGAAGPSEIVAFFARLRQRAGDRLTTFEIIPRFGLEIVTRHAPGARDPLEGQHASYALVELTSPEPNADLEALLLEVLEPALEAGEIADATLAASDQQAAAFWHLREALSEYQKHEGASIKHDVSVPISRVADFLIEASAACEAAMPGLRVCAFGHIGDGNIHFNLSQPVGMEPKAFLAEWHRFNGIVHDETAKRGGSIAAEHGVGLFKRDELPHYKDAVALRLMETLKRALDPENRLNPGKVIALGNDLPMFTPGG
ncbi:MAG: FAD-binding oxidoreductase [Beijerinckiaceae bacterium]|jgi:FAD/FMN-containing dehydrogenase|nr:FAD-binding oxidoreductase [Beijerinckiaceae bacterium]